MLELCYEAYYRQSVLAQRASAASQCLNSAFTVGSLLDYDRGRQWIIAVESGSHDYRSCDAGLESGSEEGFQDSKHGSGLIRGSVGDLVWFFG